VAGVREILATEGLDERALGNTPDLPSGPQAMAGVLRSGGSSSPIYMNCSGKHAGMVVTCRHRGWPIESYLERDHPLQVRISDTIAEFIGESCAHVGVDGCGAPAHAMPLVALARAFRAVALTQPAVYGAMTGFPHVVGGTGHDGTGWMQAIPGLLAKDGAEGARARPVVLAGALARLGVDVSPAASVWRVPVLGHGRAVGEVRAAGTLAGALEY
jgi:L-asparaginase II